MPDLVRLADEEQIDDPAPAPAGVIVIDGLGLTLEKLWIFHEAWDAAWTPRPSSGSPTGSSTD